MDFILDLLYATTPGTLLSEAVRAGNPILPIFMADADNIPAGPKPYHSGSVLAHMARCMNEVAGDTLAVWMALAHDAGKLITPSTIWPHHYGHELRGILLATLWALHFSLPKRYKQAGAFTAYMHMNAGRYCKLRPGKKHDVLMASMASGVFEQFWKVVDADTKSNISKQAAADLQKITAINDSALSADRLRLLRIEALCKKH